MLSTSYSTVNSQPGWPWPWPWDCGLGLGLDQLALALSVLALLTSLNSTGRVYERTQTLSTQAWPLSVTDRNSAAHEVSE